MTGTPPSPERPSSERDARLARARRMLEIYGADPARWPAEERALFERYKDDYRFYAARVDAESLDALLASSPEEAPGDAFRMHLLDLAPKRGGRRFAPVAFIAARLVPAGALAALSVFGFAAGFASAGLDSGGLSYAETAAASVFESASAAWTEDGV